jgi:hypothetical protein
MAGSTSIKGINVDKGVEIRNAQNLPGVVQCGLARDSATPEPTGTRMIKSISAGSYAT